MKDSKFTDNQLDLLLGEEEPYIPDGGFAQRVIKLLPPPVARPAWMKLFILTLAAATGSILTLAFLPVSVEEILLNLVSMITWMDYVDFHTFSDKMLQILIPVVIVTTTASISLIFAQSESG